MDAPPARKNEAVNESNWQGWKGPVSTLRDNLSTFDGTNDAWVPRITLAQNDDPSILSQPVMRSKGDGTPIGGFYVPVGHHLRILLAEKDNGGGWFKSGPQCPSTACIGVGTSVWVTRADAYSYPDRDPLLLLEPNVNAFQNTFEDGTIWFDVSAVDGVNANV